MKTLSEIKRSTKVGDMWILTYHINHNIEIVGNVKSDAMSFQDKVRDNLSHMVGKPRKVVKASSTEVGLETVLRDGTSISYLKWPKASQCQIMENDENTFLDVYEDNKLVLSYKLKR